MTLTVGHPGIYIHICIHIYFFSIYPYPYISIYIYLYAVSSVHTELPSCLLLQLLTEAGRSDLPGKLWEGCIGAPSSPHARK